MKVLKESGNYLQKQAKLNRNLAIIFLVIGLVTLIIFVGIFFICVSIYFFIKRSHYKKGYSGEQSVIKSLQNLPDSYYLINDIKLPNSYGNIDHIILGQNGIFIIETKNFEGQIRCDGDLWYQYKPEWEIAAEYEINSPSKQVKGNALKLKQFVESKNIFKNTLKLWVEGIIVFPNSNVELNINNSTVSVMKTDNLYSYIKNKQTRIKFSSNELESIGKAILESQ